MSLPFLGSLSLRDRYLRIGCWTTVFVLVIAANFSVVKMINQRTSNAERDSINQSQDILFFRAVKDLAKLKTLIGEAQKLGADVTIVQTKFQEAETLLFTQHQTLVADKLIQAAITVTTKLIADQTAANSAAAAAKQQGTIVGTAKEGTSLLAAVKVTIIQNSVAVASTTTDINGVYLVTAAAGTYVLTASKSGYTTLTQKSVVITAGTTLTDNLTLVKAPAAAPVASSSLTNGESTFDVRTVNAGGTNFTVDVATFNLASGQFRVITDTANDSDCLDNCPTKSLSSFVSANGGFAGMNGTYFCPADYASCAGKTGSFYWKVWNSRLNKMINGDTNSFVYEPFLTVNGNVGKYYDSWSDFSGSISAGISSSPALISGGRNVLDQSKLDDKQRTVKSNRGGAGFKGQTLYFVIAKSATVIDLGTIMSALGLDYAMNLDGGGSSALIFNGAYKVGPGRNIPNALIVARR